MVKPHSEGILVAGKTRTYTCVRERLYKRDCMIEMDGNFFSFLFFNFSPQLVLLLVA